MSKASPAEATRPRRRMGLVPTEAGALHDDVGSNSEETEDKESIEKMLLFLIDVDMIEIKKYNDEINLELSLGNITKTVSKIFNVQPKRNIIQDSVLRLAEEYLGEATSDELAKAFSWRDTRVRDNEGLEPLQEKEPTRIDLKVLFDRADEIAATAVRGRPRKDASYQARIDSIVRLSPSAIDWLKSKSPQHMSYLSALVTALMEADEAGESQEPSTDLQ